MNEQAKLKAAVTRAGNQYEKIVHSYGANDIPPDHPLHAKAVAAKKKHREAVKALREYQP